VKIRSWIVFALISIVLLSCDPNRVYDEYKEIPKYTWNYKENVNFNINIEDTTILYNMYINVRHTSDYMFSNLYLFIDIKYPDNKISRDTVECVLADDRGRWLGEGLGGMWDSKILIKKSFKFNLSGEYKFDIYQAMRVDDLTDIMDIGLRIEKYMPKKK